MLQGGVQLFIFLQTRYFKASVNDVLSLDCSARVKILQITVIVTIFPVVLKKVY